MRTVTKAFSLLEVMIVLGILGLLASIAIPKYQNYLEKGKYKTSQINLKKVGEAMELYHAEHGVYPVFSSWNDLSSEQSVLSEFLAEIPKGDQWKRPYEIQCQEQTYLFKGKAIPKEKLARNYPDYVVSPGPVLKSGNLAPASPATTL